MFLSKRKILRAYLSTSPENLNSQWVRSRVLQKLQQHLPLEESKWQVSTTKSLSGNIIVSFYSERYKELKHKRKVYLSLLKGSIKKVEVIQMCNVFLIES